MQQTNTKGTSGGNGLRTAITDAKRFFIDEIWDQDTSGLPGLKRAGISFCRIIMIVIKGFFSDKCGLQASALTYITLMSLIPILALMFSVSKGMGAQNRLMEVIGLQKVEHMEIVNGEETLVAQFEVVPPATPGEEPRKLAALPVPAQRVVTQIFTYVENTNLVKLGTIGFIMVFSAVITSLAKVESTFNSIWGVQTSRTWLRKFTDYISVLVIVPVFFLAATSAVATMSSPALINELREWLGPVASLYARLIRLSGFLFIALAFSFLYSFMPNMRVRVFPALTAGIVGGLLWYFLQWLYITSQVGLAKFNAIYGTFAAVPFFLAWLYANWTIVLFGAEVSFAVQNHRTYLMEGMSVSAPHSVREALGLVFAMETCRSMLTGEAPWDSVSYAQKHTIPARLMSDVGSALVESHILFPVVGEAGHYVPALDIGSLTPGHVERALRKAEDPYAVQFGRLAGRLLRDVFAEGYSQFDAKLSSVSFRELLTQAESRDQA